MRDSTLPTEDAAASPSTAAEQAHVQCNLEREGTRRYQTEGEGECVPCEPMAAR